MGGGFGSGKKSSSGGGGDGKKAAGTKPRPAAPQAPVKQAAAGAGTTLR